MSHPNPFNVLVSIWSSLVSRLRRIAERRRLRRSLFAPRGYICYLILNGKRYAFIYGYVHTEEGNQYILYLSAPCVQLDSLEAVSTEEKLKVVRRIEELRNLGCLDISYTWEYDLYKRACSAGYAKNPEQFLVETTSALRREANLKWPKWLREVDP
jgi:hypothetical protein